MNAASPLAVEARRVMCAEAAAVTLTAQRLDHVFVAAVALLDECRKAGRMVWCSGVGKSGHVAAHVAAKLSACGTPADFLHPVEAMHGDIGRVRSGDVCVAFSRSGACLEMITFTGVMAGQSDPKPVRCKVVAVTQDPASPMARYADLVLAVHPGPEACGYDLVPTASTAASMALGDALALCLMQVGNFGPEDFRKTHPGGALGGIT
jgi:arabinose-5-phosphate isomerase